MNPDIDPILKEWECKPGLVQARIVEARDGRQVVQMRVDMGVLQMEIDGRPDGSRPEGAATYLEHLRAEARRADERRQPFTLSEDQCQEADREFLQYYHRRISWLALKEYDRAIRDADHTLTFMDFVADHSPSEEYTQAHEQYRGFVLFHRTQAAAALQVERDRPEAAIDEVLAGLDRLRTFFEAFDAEEQMEEDGMVQHLRRIEASLREEYGIRSTLREQLEEAVAAEDYEKAARLRDALRKR